MQESLAGARSRIGSRLGCTCSSSLVGAVHRLPGTCTFAHQSLGYSKERSVCSPLGLRSIGSDCPPCSSLSERPAQDPRCAGSGSGNAALAAPDDPRAPSEVPSPLSCWVSPGTTHVAAPCFLRLMLLSVGRPVPLLCSQFSGTTLLHIRLALLAK